MTGTQAVQGAFRVDVDGEMTIEWDVPIETDDGVILRADVFRPTAPGAYPTILSYGPYGKGLPFQQSFPDAWQKMIADYPEVLDGSSGKYQNWEVADPEKWVPDGYVCVRVDARGSGRSPGYLDLNSEREIRDLYACIEWAAEQPWSSGRVGLNGISYLAMNQWRVAALQPPHLTAICVWEGAGDLYRDSSYHGGIRSSFVAGWFRATIATQYGVGEKGGRNPLTGQLICGDETFSDEELAQRRADFVKDTSEHPFFDDYYRSRSTDWSRIKVPLLSAGNWGGQGLHLRGNTRGFELAASADKWLEMHDDAHWSLFYAKYGHDLQKRFFGHFLKGEDTGWSQQPRVQLRTRHVDGHIEMRTASHWPLAETEWTRFHLDVNYGSMGPEEPAAGGARTYDAGQQGRLSFTYVCPQDLEIAGPVAAKLYVESSTPDVDLFLVLRAFSPEGEEIVYHGAIEPHSPIAQGWLRASHRALDEVQSRPFLPVHRHDRAEPLTPATVYEVDVEIWPTSLVLPAGYTLTLDVQGHDYVYPGASGFMTGSGPFVHKDPSDRPADVFGGKVALHTGGRNTSYLLLPVIPA
jgi:putative CocE/NonD family hydrolase